MSDLKPTPNSSPATSSPWMTVPEAAQYARRGHSAVYDACRTGQLKATQSVAPRGKWQIHRDDVDTWLRGGIAMKPARNRRASA